MRSLLGLMVVLCDIFSVPIYSDRKFRQKDWNNACACISRLGLTGNCQYSFAELHLLVLDGFLSAQSATYFLSGRASLKQVAMLDAFIAFKDDLVYNQHWPSSRILQLWQKNNAVEMENTFLFPLVELDSSNDFTKDLESYNNVSLVELQKIQ